MIHATRKVLATKTIVNPKIADLESDAKRKTRQAADAVDIQFFTHLMTVSNPQTNVFIFTKNQFSAHV